MLSNKLVSKPNSQSMQLQNMMAKPYLNCSQNIICFFSLKTISQGFEDIFGTVCLKKQLDVPAALQKQTFFHPSFAIQLL